ncbi:5-oxoprolinase subunit PxpA [Gordonia soli]|uniref:LamB/YcsF family protein n=1 Tax=Gordonia soli NBRC 108243 TaxID=1223545 RepID=M0QP39_9ACTN|nr:5-oxoprolinase subunit PxpA [Gordonia soli]GAC70405.1 hypothetical protein GS4_34_00910 [Gordonia soli NBRC 108243]
MSIVDLNCDLGESFGVYTHGADGQMMPMITSANIACGAHGGDPAVMRRSVELASSHGVAIGAHVGLPDRIGFGRREIPTTPQEAYDLCLYQVGALDAYVRARGLTMQHLKLHGALYMMANRDPDLAEAVCSAVNDLGRTLLLYVLPGSALHAAALDVGITAVGEIFADRPYLSGAVQMYERTAELIGSIDTIITRTVHQLAESDHGQLQSVCVHSDTPDAPVILAALRPALIEAGHSFSAPASSATRTTITAPPLVPTTLARGIS